MNQNKALKAQEVEALKKTFAEDEIVIVTRNNGLTVKQVTDLRRAMRKEGANFKVSKNTLVKRALEGSKFAGIADLFTGPIAVASSKDPMAAARVAYKFAKDNEKLVIVGGANADGVMDAEKIKFLATLPTLDELRGKLVGILQAPGAQLARVVNAYATKGQ